MIRSVCQFHIQYPTGASPRLICFPDINVLVSYWVVVETAVTRSDRGFNIIGLTRVTCHRSGLRITSPQNVQALIATQAELDRDRAARLNAVVDWDIIHGLEEAGEIIVHLQLRGAEGGVTVTIVGSQRHGCISHSHRCSSRGTLRYRHCTAVIGGDRISGEVGYQRGRWSTSSLDRLVRRTRDHGLDVILHRNSRCAGFGVAATIRGRHGHSVGPYIGASERVLG